jgi:hypothetical protein
MIVDVYSKLFSLWRDDFTYWDWYDEPHQITNEHLEAAEAWAMHVIKADPPCFPDDNGIMVVHD